jgi:hypothetical protein
LKELAMDDDVSASVGSAVQPPEKKKEGFTCDWRIED